MNATVGDIAGNAERIRAGAQAAREQGAELVAVPRARAHRLPARGPAAARSTSSPTPRAALRCARRRDARGIVAIVGFPERAEDVYNAAAVLADGKVHAVYRKVHLPNYGVFDEQRYFQAGPRRRRDRPRRHSASG